jgi:octaprenyl-diphosphate synthase
LLCETLGGTDAALPLAPLVEFSHNASLIHDDIEDNSPERRGKPAVHLLYGLDTAINSGSFLYFLPLSCIEPWAAALEQRAHIPVEAAKSKAYALWGEYMRRLHLGQAMDIAWHRDINFMPGINEYLEMCALKTGCLARFAAALGVCAAATVSNEAAGHEAALSESLGNAAEKLGLGFQILDDVKNLSGDIAGKLQGDDVVEGKKSLPILLFLRRHPEQKEFVCRCFTEARLKGAGASEVQELVQTLKSASILDEAKEQGLALIEEAREIFALPLNSGFPMLEEGRELLAGLTRLIS